MWLYKQLTGELFQNGYRVGVGYSGHSQGRNNPAMESIADTGPIPCGNYVIGEPFDSSTHGPHVMRLTPDVGTDELGRSGFLLHGDNMRHDASLGCIIMSRSIRDLVSSSGDISLQVVSK